MVAKNRYKHLIVRKILPLLCLALGLVVAGLIAAAPADLLDAMVGRLPLAALIPAAAPPVGVTARTLLALAGGGGIAFLGLLPRLARLSSRRRRATRLGATPPVRRADAHPDAPACRPIAARSELGEPLAEAAGPTDVEHALPTDLDLPLAAFAPEALASRAEVAERPAESIAALLDRLERGAAARARSRGLGDTLGALRNLATH